MTDLLTTKQVAERLGVTVSTVNRWAASKELPTAHEDAVSKTRYYDPEVIRALQDYTNQKAAS